MQNIYSDKKISFVLIRIHIQFDQLILKYITCKLHQIFELHTNSNEYT